MTLALALLAAALSGSAPAGPGAQAAPLPIARINARIPVEADGPATFFRPAELHGAFRVPPSNDALAIGTQWDNDDLRVTIVYRDGTRSERRGDRSLPGTMYGVALPPDVAAAERVEVRLRSVSTRITPYLLTGMKLATIAWRNWIFHLFFGLSVGLALVAAILGVMLRSRAYLWYAVVLLAQAADDVQYLGIWRPDIAVNVPLNLVVALIAPAALVMFTLAYVRLVPRALEIALWCGAGLMMAQSAGDLLLQDRWEVPDIAVRGLLATFGLLVVAAGVAGRRARIAGADVFIAGAVVALAGNVTTTFAELGIYSPALQLADATGTAIQAALLAIAISLQLRRDERDRLRYATLATVDGLTGIANRRTFDERLAAEWERARRAQAPLALVMLDVDRFKAYNDAYGHPAGDAVLRTIADVLVAETPRRDDLVARYGGEEFAALLPATSLDGAREIAERLRARVAALEIPHGGAEPPYVTISAGVASVVPADGDAGALVVWADAALYEAKSEGRNRVGERSDTAVA